MKNRDEIGISPTPNVPLVANDAPQGNNINPQQYSLKGRPINRSNRSLNK